ncbi:RluA family pseudouridine synthase [Enterobacteriaceae endosymbiont of Plateumaris pusilla]|uniref:RluA family pseudouridine synthase n=1 Tax=Enterobacteriaceae endosymbiont of Plateumaris pusilla TaxID=2675795 RepID=UPI00145747E1|nr:RluA family pseudouridine synthase [Enterobacteriaceae endosymbiont of Plateumaris pusilla]
MKIIKFSTIVYKSDAGMRLDVYLANKLFKFYSRSQIKNWIINNNIKINNIIINKPKKKIFIKDEIKINIKISQKKILWKAQNIPLNIIYDDNYLLIINKTSNLVVHPGNGNPDKTVFNSLLYNYPFLRDLPRAGIIHRLDKNTTGLMIIAKTMLSYINLKIALKKHNIIREYEAIVSGIIKYNNDIINYPIRKYYNKKNIRMIIDHKGKQAVTKYFLKRIFKNHSHLRIKLCTGRTHQIRVHLEHINHSIVGDPIYKKSQINIITMNDKQYLLNKILKRQALHACNLKFIHPIYNYPLNFHSSLPKDMQYLISILEKIK